jgi:hypothetical protein
MAHQSRNLVACGPLPAHRRRSGPAPKLTVSKYEIHSTLLRGRRARLHIPRLDIPLGKGGVVAYNSTPMRRDLNRSDRGPLGDAILD